MSRGHQGAAAVALPPYHRFYVFLKHTPTLNTGGLSTPSSPGPAARAGLGGSIQAGPSLALGRSRRHWQIRALRGLQARGCSRDSTHKPSPARSCFQSLAPYLL